MARACPASVPAPSPFEPLPFGSGTSPATLITTSPLAGLSLLGPPFVGMKAMRPACVLTVTEAVPSAPIVAGKTPRLLVTQPCPPLAAPLLLPYAPCVRVHRVPPVPHPGMGVWLHRSGSRRRPTCRGRRRRIRGSKPPQVLSMHSSFVVHASPSLQGAPDLGVVVQPSVGSQLAIRHWLVVAAAERSARVAELVRWIAGLRAVADVVVVAVAVAVRAIAPGDGRLHGVVLAPVGPDRSCRSCTDRDRCSRDRAGRCRCRRCRPRPRCRRCCPGRACRPACSGACTRSPDRSHRPCRSSRCCSWAACPARTGRRRCRPRHRCSGCRRDRASPPGGSRRSGCSTAPAGSVVTLLPRVHDAVAAVLEGERVAEVRAQHASDELPRVEPAVAEAELPVGHVEDARYVVLVAQLDQRSGDADEDVARPDPRPREQLRPGVGAELAEDGDVRPARRR